MSYVQTWKSVEACKLVAEKDITPKNLICRPCRDDVRRMVGNPDYVPRWEKGNERVKCCIKDCTEVSHVFSNIATVEKICCPFLKRIIFILREIQFRFQPCCVRVTITQSTSQSSHSKLTAPPMGCPLSMWDADHAQMQSVVGTHLRNSAGYEGNLSNGDKVCYSCYKSHLIYIYSYKKRRN